MQKRGGAVMETEVKTQPTEKAIKIRNAVLLGTLCAIAYLAVYVARNILSTVTPQMTAQGIMTAGQIGTLSSIYFIVYAFGQLINGSIGDHLSPKYMISLGLLLAGAGTVVFPLVANTPGVANIAYGFTAFCLSMIYGPMTKVVAENVDPQYAPRCSLGYNFSSFFGSPLAGVLAMFLAWQGVFVSSGALLVVMGIVFFAAFCLMQRHGIIQSASARKEVAEADAPASTGGVWALLQHHIVKFSVVALVTGVVRTTVVFWLPTYLAQHLHYSSEQAALIFSIATLIISFNAFAAVFIYERLGHNIHKAVLLFFVLSAVCFTALYFVAAPIPHIVLLVLAIFAADCAASMLWSCYCPSLRETGMVSTATGFLDFLSYLAASVSSTIFAGAVSSIGWGGLILVWAALMAVGVLVSLPFHEWKAGRRKNI